MTNKQRMRWAVLGVFLLVSAVSAFGFEAPAYVVATLGSLAGAALFPEASGLLEKLWRNK